MDDDDKGNDSDDELAKLEREEFGEKTEIKDEEVKIVKKKEEKIEPKIPEKVDLYPVFLEKAFHKHEKFASIGCLEKEKELMEEIMKIKEKDNLDSQAFKDKLMYLNLQAQKITNLVEAGKMSLDQYKVTIKKQQIYEQSVYK